MGNWEIKKRDGTLLFTVVGGDEWAAAFAARDELRRQNVGMKITLDTVANNIAYLTAETIGEPDTFNAYVLFLHKV